MVNASNASRVPNELTAYAAHSHPNRRPRDRPATLPGMLHLRPARTPRGPRPVRDPDIQASGPPTGQTTASRSAHNRRLCTWDVRADLAAVRTRVTTADTGRFRDAAPTPARTPPGV
ncbi:hypothetical protein SCA03_44500 [Streptomyces cacaoi]|uniref:Uncharacterized protein n=1 Tax=Streptomyces cacaoi TaxID=1898 RepID=A0A4Y3R3M9_STRCI|nr:hypothetical protein SCA03_44500 [Streptomyces cacaoi]